MRRAVAAGIKFINTSGGKMNKEVELFAAEIRFEIARQMAKLGFGHVGGAMSMAGFDCSALWKADEL